MRRRATARGAPSSPRRASRTTCVRWPRLAPGGLGRRRTPRTRGGRRLPRRAPRPARSCRSGTRRRRPARADRSRRARDRPIGQPPPAPYTDARMIDTEKYAAATVVSRRDLATDLWVVRIRPDVRAPVPSRPVRDPGPGAGRPHRRAPVLDRLGPGRGRDRALHRARPRGRAVRPAPRRAHRREHAGAQALQGPVPQGRACGRSAPPLRRHRHRDRALRQHPAQSAAAPAGAGSGPPTSPCLLSRGRAGPRSSATRRSSATSTRRCDWFTYVPTISRPWDEPEWTGETGRVEDVMRKHADAAGLVPGSGADLPLRSPRDDHQRSRDHAPPRIRRQGHPRRTILARLRRR